MNQLWPQLPPHVAQRAFIEIDWDSTLTPGTAHPHQTWAPVGGVRVSEADVEHLAQRIAGLALECGFPAPSDDKDRARFDRAAAHILFSEMRLTFSEAGSPGVWSFLALIALPHLTEWRFGHSNVERWVHVDPARHTWGRLWWQGRVFAGHRDLFAKLREADLNQLFERRLVGGNPRLVIAISEALIGADLESVDVARREIVRDVTKRLRRRLGFLDVSALTDDQLARACRALVDESMDALVTARAA